MKRALIMMFCTLIIMLFLPQTGFAEETVDLAPHAKSALLMDVDTGTIIYSKNPDVKLPPASITKIMTMLLVMEAIEKGSISLNDKVRASEYAASMGGSQIFLEPGEEMSVQDLLKGVAVASGNDAAVALAEYIAGTEEEFVKRMNQKAKELGMNNTHFQNSNGLPAPDHFTTARDIAIMSRELLRYDKITKYTSIYQDYLRKESKNPFWLVNTNRLVRFYPGMDGLKTGYTDEAKFCLSATAKRGNLRLVAVVLGEPNAKLRNAETVKLLDYAFSQYTLHVLYPKDAEVAKVRIDKGSPNQVSAVTSFQVGILTKRGVKAEDYQKQISLTPQLKAPLQKGEVIGKLKVTREGTVVGEVDLVLKEDSKRIHFGEMYMRVFHTLLSF
ncbi:D-alanyl-D-alanine carboxypeptidase family protein [Thermicanus aegyptius]|uniref:D-alanyl-D-alanine carboxypeptidase family protein n=1 Tax=Thermicanus aegyptius TaxID=94009 RepID=UPI0003FEFCF3|nr:D-alanyl-D-alanine carboxypeptidase family protein [Thermicanus aegyptius]